MDKMGGVMFFCRCFFAPSRRKTSWANPCVFQNCSSFKFFWIKGTILSIVFVSQCQKNCGEPSNDSKNLGHPKNFLHNR